MRTSSRTPDLRRNRRHRKVAALIAFALGAALHADLRAGPSSGPEADRAPSPAPGPRLFGIDFNRNDALGSPSQAMFRVIAGSATRTANAATYRKTIGPHRITVTRPDGKPFEFRGADAGANRAIPGGSTSRSYLVADFIATRQGAIDIAIEGLPSGTYLFRSFHLDSLTSGPLGFAQGASTTTPNTIEARLGGSTRASVRPTALGSSGLGTTSISDAQIPTLQFPFTHDGASPLVIELRATIAKGSDHFLLLNGFEILGAAP